MKNEANKARQPTSRNKGYLPGDSMPYYTNGEVQLKFADYGEGNYQAQDRGERIVTNNEAIGERG